MGRGWWVLWGGGGVEQDLKNGALDNKGGLHKKERS